MQSGSVPQYTGKRCLCVPDHRKGRHTTTSSRLYRLPSGILIIDSPGIRELKLWADGDDLAASFSDIASLAEQCRFSDCSHEGEPGCAVQAALASGELDEGRYRFYLQLQREQAWLDRRLDDQALRAEKARWKQISSTRCHDPICTRRGSVVGSVAEDRSNEAIHRR